MISLASLLTPELVVLRPSAATLSAATLEVAGLLRQDPRVVDWQAFAKGAAGNVAEVPLEKGVLRIPHLRTATVRDLVMAAGRFSSISDVEGIGPVHIFVVGVPAAMASDYLRVIGALTRIFRDPETQASLAATGTAASYSTRISSSERRL